MAYRKLHIGEAETHVSAFFEQEFSHFKFFKDTEEKDKREVNDI